MSKKIITRSLGFLVVANTVLFLVLAYLHDLPTDPKAAIYVDFWGRFTVYSLWFIGFVLYRRYVHDSVPARRVVITLVSLNIPFFLLLAYFDKISMEPDSIVFVDFWGRITVYSFWVICYEAYRSFIERDELGKAGSKLKAAK